jgi:hypothetical protein
MADYAALIRPTELLEGPTPLRIDELGAPALFTQAARFRPGAFASDADRTAAFTHATMVEYGDPRRAAYR